jgi:hypothetical protein
MERVAGCLLFVAGTVLAGCGSNEERLVPVAGVVLLDGKPVAQAAVMFHHEAGRTSYAVTGTDGSFQLTTRAPGDGVPAGEHHVTVSLVAQEGGVQANDKGLEDYTKPVAPARLTYVVPKVYNDPKTSPIVFRVARPTRSLHIDLDSRVR